MPRTLNSCNGLLLLLLAAATGAITPALRAMPGDPVEALGGTAEARTTGGGAASIESIEDILERVAQRIVALKVSRDEEESSVLSRQQLRGVPRREREQVRTYFRRPSGEVTGLLLDKEGYILTSNYNVAGSVDKIVATLFDGTESTAEVVARDPLDDVALLKLNAALPETLDLGALEWGSHEDFRAGRFVLAVGASPGGGTPTATLGIISAPQRNSGRQFQTDAELNYGNSGGPILALDGAVLGVATFVGHLFPHWGLNSGVGFGTRADTIDVVLPVLKEGGAVRLVQPLLGIRGGGVDPGDGDDEEDGDEEADAREAPEETPPVPFERGARILEVVAESGAGAAGLKADDVIVEFDRLAVEDFTQLRHLILQRKPGDVVSVRVKRADEVLDFEVRLGKNAEDI